MAKAERLSKKEIENLEISDLRDFLYGAVQSMIENDVPSGIVHHYLMPPIPFGPELASFMKLGKEPEPAEGTDESGKVIYTGNDMMRAAINFARLVDMVPVTDPKKPGRPDEQKVIDLTQLLASGDTISKQWEALLTPGNCFVVNNELSDKEKAIQQKLYNLLYKGPIDPAEEEGEPAP
ncbi:MAG: hypothetical protein V2J51_13340, partial [Erythrobacter sp.]|nr:hypothetical protein [Erythrobacter sp.]